MELCAGNDSTLVPTFAIARAAPALQQLYLRMNCNLPSDLPGSFPTLQSLDLCPWSFPAAPPPFWASLTSLCTLTISCGDFEVLTLDARWRLPALTSLNLGGIVPQPVLLGPGSDLAAAFPVLRELRLIVPAAPEDLPSLPPSLTSVDLEIHSSGKQLRTEEACQGGGLPRLLWTAASPLCSLPALEELKLYTWCAYSIRVPDALFINSPRLCRVRVMVKGVLVPLDKAWEARLGQARKARQRREAVTSHPDCG
jgi:hypothetical protein